MTSNRSEAKPAPSKPADAKPPDIASASIPDTLASLQVHPDAGLARAEVDVRRKEHGFNEVAEHKTHPVLMFLSKFWGLSAWMLELIMVLSVVLGNFADLAVVGALLVVNAVLSFMQEHRAAGVVETLRRRLQVSARVLREASWQVIPARELVPGDIVRVRPGVVIVLSLVRGSPLLEMVPLLLVLLTSAVPVALPVMFTVSMAFGSRELAKCGVLVTRLSAVEDAATMDVLCVDKTGTITMNQLAVTGVIPLERATEADVLFAGALASQDANQDPIDLSLLAAAKERHIFDGRPVVTPVSFTPFDATNRRTEAVVEQNGQRLQMMKGRGNGRPSMWAKAPCDRGDRIAGR